MAQSRSDTVKVLGSKNPLTTLKKWLKQAQKNSQLKEPWAMCLSTIDARKKPQSRIVLLKKLEKNQLIFFTNYLSPKGKDLKTHPVASVVFFWPELEKQIRISGTIKKTSRKTSSSYWRTRHRDSQLSQWISQQSQPIQNRKTLKDLQKKAREKFKNKPIPCPPHWGGYALQIQKIEFWQGQPYRLHDRFLFLKTPSGWSNKRLFP